jgi:hypothetical protein
MTMRTVPTITLDGSSRSNLASVSFPVATGYGCVTSCGAFISSTAAGDCYIYNENMFGSARLL